MNKETKKIMDLLDKNNWFDNIFMNTNSDMLKDKDFIPSKYKKIKEINWLLRSKNNNIYFIGIGEEKIIASTADVVLYCLHEKEEFYLVPFYLFSSEYLDKNNLNNCEFDDFLFYLKRAKSYKIYDYSINMIKYIEWYKEQGYPIYEYIPRLEVFLKEQIELWKDKFEKIKNEE
jgi:hypothetical protein